MYGVLTRKNEFEVLILGIWNDLQKLLSLIEIFEPVNDQADRSFRIGQECCQAFGIKLLGSFVLLDCQNTAYFPVEVPVQSASSH